MADNLIPEYEDSFFEATLICPMMMALSLVFIAEKLHIPMQFVAMSYGTLMGITYVTVPQLMAKQFQLWGPDNIVVLVHPIMIIKMAYTVDAPVFRKSFWQIMLLSTVGTGLFIVGFGFLALVITGRDVNFVNVIAAGTTLAAIDVPEVLVELNSIKNLEVVMDGESVFGTTLCIILYNICLGVYDESVRYWYQVIAVFLRFVIGGTIIGLALGKSAAYFFQVFHMDFKNAVSLIFGTCYAAYYLSEIVASCSGALATFIVAYLINKKRFHLPYQVDRTVNQFLDGAYQATEMIACVILSAYTTLRMVEIYSGFDGAVAIGAYIMGNVLRILIMVILSPCLSRMGLGFNVTALFTIFWGAKRGSLQLLQVIYVYYNGLTSVLGTELLCFTLTYLVLTFLINMTSLGYILKYFGLIKFTPARKFNITECIKLLKSKNQKVIYSMRMNRNYTNVNWKLINKTTELNNPFEEMSNASGVFNLEEVVCPTCYRHVPFIKDEQEFAELYKFVKTKVLKRQRISLVRQNEIGLLGKNDLEGILQQIEAALASSDVTLKYENFIDLFQIDPWMLRLKKRLSNIKIKNVATEYRRGPVYYCTRFFRKTTYKIIKLVLILLNFIMILVWAIYWNLESPHAEVILAVGYSFVFVFWLDMVMKWVAYPKRVLCRVYYKHSFWHISEVFFNCWDLISLIISFTYYVHYLRYGGLVRVICTVQILIRLVPNVITLINRKIDENLFYAYKFALAVVMSIEDVESDMHLICSYAPIREHVNLGLQEYKLQLVRNMVKVTFTRPHVPSTLATYIMKRTILNTMMGTTDYLQDAGILEESEVRRIVDVLDSMMRTTNLYYTVYPNSARAIVKNVQWMGDDDEMFEFIYANVIMRIWEPNEVVIEAGQYPDGIYIILKGLIRASYVPTEEVSYKMNNYGMMPIRGYQSNKAYDESEEEYLFEGTCFGEISFLTGHPFSSRIYAVEGTSGVLIKTEILNKALQFNLDPVYGFKCRLWKFCTNKVLAKLIVVPGVLFNVDYLTKSIERAFVPEISHYKTLQVTNYIEDLYLVNGYVIDRKSKRRYTAPAHLPRSIHQIYFPDDSIAKLIIIPRISVDPYTVMETTENISELQEVITPTDLIQNFELRKFFRERALLEAHLASSGEDLFYKSSRIFKNLQEEARSSRLRYTANVPHVSELLL